MMGEGFSGFQRLVKRYMLLEVLLAALTKDREPLGGLKMGVVYQSLTDQVIERVMRDIAQAKKQIRESKGEIIQIFQELEERVIYYKFEGYQHRDMYLNEWIRVDCMEMLKEYLKLV